MRYLMKLTALLLCLLLAATACGEETVLTPQWGVPDYVVWLLDVAAAEVGYTEARNGTTKYGVWSGVADAEWCAEYLCWCVDQVDKQYGTRLLQQIYPNYSANNTGRDWFLKQGRYIARRGVVSGWGSQWFHGADTIMTANSYIPQPGDWVFFCDNSKGDTSHVAMVEFCTADELGNVYVHVLEGNNPEAVARNVYPLTYWAIQGYGTVFDLADITLKKGCEGEKVKVLQRQLVQLGLMDSQYVTGVYGDITQNAVLTFQKKQGLQETGVADLNTRQEIAAALV